MQEFFEFLERKSLYPEKVHETISQWDGKTLFDFTREIQTYIPYVREKPPSQFGFIANTPLSGGAYPCAALDCRLTHIDRMARFAALYGDQVIIQDPFRQYSYEPPRYLEPYRESVIGDLLVFHELRPLLESDLVGVAARSTAFCEEHLPQIIRKGNLRKAELALHKQFSQTITTDVKYDDPFIVIHVSGPENLIEHGETNIIRIGKELKVSTRKNKSGKISLIGKSRREIIENLSGNILVDLIQQDIYSSQYGLNYLTDREVDLDVLEATNDQDTKRFSQAVIEGFSHSLPFLEHVSLSSLLKLRQEEGESFQVYRDTVSSILKALKPTEADKVKQAFNDAVLPEIRKIDLTVNNAKKLLKRSIGSNILFGAGLITVGLASGFLPPDAGKILATVGGFQFGVNALQSMYQLMREPDSIHENKFYFLWKVRQQSKR